MTLYHGWTDPGYYARVLEHDVERLRQAIAAARQDGDAEREERLRAAYRVALQALQKEQARLHRASRGG